MGCKLYRLWHGSLKRIIITSFQTQHLVMFHTLHNYVQAPCECSVLWNICDQSWWDCTVCYQCWITSDKIIWKDQFMGSLIISSTFLRHLLELLHIYNADMQWRTCPLSLILIYPPMNLGFIFQLLPETQEF